MPVTLTVPQAAVAVRLNVSPTAVVREPHNGILTRLVGVSTAQIRAYLDSAYDDVDDDTLNEAAARMVGYLYDAPPYSRTPINAFVSSGARALLAGYRVGVSAHAG